MKVKESDFTVKTSRRKGIRLYSLGKEDGEVLECSCGRAQIVGLPCPHILFVGVSQGLDLSFLDVNKKWFLEYQESNLTTEQTPSKKIKGRLRNSSTKKSTRLQKLKENSSTPKLEEVEISEKVEAQD